MNYLDPTLFCIFLGNSELLLCLDDEDNLDDEEVDEEELGLEAVYKDNLDVSHLIFC